jgi:uncharacterized MAPEG superfamily protein
MTTDLICLLILALWTLPLNHIPAIARVTRAGVAWGLSNRDTMPEVPDWVCRADRAQRNHHDNLAMIATVILIAQVAQQTNGVTAIASIAVVSLRILHSLTYIAGIPTVRSLAYAGSIASLLVIVWQILT